MPPFVALLICTAVVLLLLRLEWRGSRGVSAAVWIPTIWMLITASRPLGTWFGVAGDNESGSMLDRLVLTGMGIFAVLLLARRRFDWSGTLRRHRWLLVLLCYMALSTLWSDITLLALKRWFREVIVLLMALVTMSEANPRQALASLLRRTAYTLLPFSVVLIKYYPSLGRRYGRWSGIEMWTGVTGQKNMLGRLCMISIIFLLFALYQRWRNRETKIGRAQARADVAIIALSLYLLMGANSSTSLATLLVGITVFLSLLWLRRLKLKVPEVGLAALVVLLIGFAASTPFLGGSNVAGFSSSLGRDDTLTGRTEVWAAVLPAMKQQPLFGYGFGSFWTDARRALYDIPTAHNGYLDIMLEQGIVGLFVYTLWLLSCARQLRRALKQDYEWASLALCFLVMALIYNATESALNSMTEHMTAVVLIASFVVPASIRVRRTSVAPVHENLAVAMPAHQISH